MSSMSWEILRHLNHSSTIPNSCSALRIKPERRIWRRSGGYTMSFSIWASHFSLLAIWSRGRRTSQQHGLQRRVDENGAETEREREWHKNLIIYTYLPEMMMLFNDACNNSFVPCHCLCWDGQNCTSSSAVVTAEIDYSTIHCSSLWVEFGIWIVSSGRLEEQLQLSHVLVEEGLSSSSSVM